MSGLVGFIDLAGKSIQKNRLIQFAQDHASDDQIMGVEYFRESQSASIATIDTKVLLQPPQWGKAENGQVELFFSGELFNDDLQDNSLITKLISRYCSEGSTLFSKLNGSFTIIVIEDFGKRITLVCDRCASLPLYYTSRRDLFVFGYRIHPFTNLFYPEIKINSEAASNFLSTGYILQGNTLIQDLKVLGPGQLITIQNDKVTCRKFWQLSYAPKRDTRSISTITSELSPIVDKCIKRRIKEDGMFGVLLSGGYDSRTILASIKSKFDGVIHTINWGENENREFSDVTVAKEIATIFNTNHHYYAMRPELSGDNFRNFVLLDEGRTDSVGNYPQSLSIFRHIKDELKLDFLMRGDEVFGWKAEVSRVSEAMHSLNIHELHNLPANYSYLNRQYHNRLAEAGRAQMKTMLKECPYNELHDIKDHFYFNERLAGYLNPLTQLKEQVIWVRNPFLDNDILDYICRLPTELRLGKKIFILSVKSMFPELTRIPIAKYGNMIDWSVQFSKSIALQTLARDILLGRENSFDKLINRRQLGNYLDRVFSTTHKPKTTFSRRVQIKVGRNLGKYRLELAEELFRLMILKTFCDEFLNGECELS